MNGLTLVVNQAFAQGHTLLTKERARALCARAGVSIDREAVEEAYAQHELTKLPAGVAAPATLAQEAIVARWFAHRATASNTLATLPATPPSAANVPQSRAWGILRASPTTLVTGLPGAGKTWLVAQAVLAAVAAGLTVACATPTGKAASVLSLKLDRFPVLTIHKLIGVVPGQLMDPTPVHADLLVIDEFSMVDVSLLACLLQAVRPTTTVVFSGDPYQLPPVGRGFPCYDLAQYLSQHKLPGVNLVHLDHVERQRAGSGVVALANALRRGEIPSGPLLGGPDVSTVRCPTDEIEPRALACLVGGELETRLQLSDPYRELLLLSPVKAMKFEAATSRLNKQISTHRFPERDLGERCKFARGDRLIFTVNNYTHGFVNGEMGTLIDYQASVRHVVIDNDVGYRYELDAYSLGQYAEWGYALTVHKAQGSEAEAVALLLHPEAKFMYSLNLIYTAVTRAKRHLVLLGDPNVLTKAVTSREVRDTNFAWLLEHHTEMERWAQWSSYDDLSKYAAGYVE